MRGQGRSHKGQVMWLWEQKPTYERNLSGPQRCVAVNPGAGGSPLLRNVAGLWNLEKTKKQSVY